MKLPIATLALLLTACAPSEPRTITTDVKALSAEPNRFSGKRVEVEGVLALGQEAMVFEDPRNESPTEISFCYADFPSSENEQRGFNRLSAAYENSSKNGMLKLERIVWVRVEGKFAHAKDTESGFGHLGQFRSQLTIERVLEAAPCDEKQNK